MRVAIAGSSGSLGTALGAALLTEGHEVVRLVRRSANSPDERSWDPTAGYIDFPRLEDVDAVVNYAGVPITGTRWSEAYKAEMTRSRMCATSTIISYLARNDRCQRFLNASTTSYYGDAGIEIVDESSPNGAGFFPEAVRKVEQEALRSPVPVAVMRIGQVISRTGGYLARTKPLFSLYFGGRIGSGRQFVSWISLADQVRATMFLLQSDLVGPVNLCSPHPVPNAQLTRAIGAYFLRPMMVPMPVPLVKAIVGSDFVDESLLPSVRARPKALTSGGFRFVHPKLRDAFSYLSQE